MTDVLVIGAGLFGWATARHLVDAGCSVTVVGPRMPGRVFSSHDDVARIVRKIGKDPVYTELHLRTLAGFAALEDRTGVELLSRRGCVVVADQPGHPYFQHARIQAAERGVLLGSQLGPFRFPRVADGFFEPSPSGSVRLPALFEVSERLVREAGGTVVNAVVVGLREQGGWRATLADGRELSAQKVVVAAGAFSSFHNLCLPVPLRRKSECVLLAEIPDHAITHWSDLPTLLWEVERPAFQGVYLIGPQRYPDGKTYIKIGSDLRGDRELPTLASIRRWFLSADHEVFQPVLEGVLRELLPDLPIVSSRTHPCIVCYTPTAHPYVVPLAEGCTLVTGGNGYGAMCSDAIGSLGAQVCLTGGYDGFDAKDFHIDSDDPDDGE